MVRVREQFKHWRTCYVHAYSTLKKVGIDIYHWWNFRITTATVRALRLLHLRRCMVASVHHLSVRLKLEIVSSLAQRSSTRRLRILFKSRAVSKPLVIVRRVMSRVHSTFHISNLKKCLADEPLAIPLDEIQVDDKLPFIKEPVEIIDREVKRLKQSHIPIVKKLRRKLYGQSSFNWERIGHSLCFVLETFINVTPPDAYSDETLFGGVTTTLDLTPPPPTSIQTTLNLEPLMSPLAPKALTFSTSPSSPLETHPYLSSLNERPPRSSNPLPKVISQGLSQTPPQPTLMDFVPTFPPINFSMSRLSAQPEPPMTRDQIQQELNQLHTLEQKIQEAIHNAQHVQESLILPTSITTIQIPPPFYPTTTLTQYNLLEHHSLHLESLSLLMNPFGLKTLLDLKYTHSNIAKEPKPL
nr:reverse transcriptase domain-containing protein [Tanacetum cinerariifolium]